MNVEHRRTGDLYFHPELSLQSEDVLVCVRQHYVFISDLTFTEWREAGGYSAHDARKFGFISFFSISSHLFFSFSFSCLFLEGIEEKANRRKIFFWLLSGNGTFTSDL